MAYGCGDHFIFVIVVYTALKSRWRMIDVLPFMKWGLVLLDCSITSVYTFFHGLEDRWGGLTLILLWNTINVFVNNSGTVYMLLVLRYHHHHQPWCLLYHIEFCLTKDEMTVQNSKKLVHVSWWLTLET